MVNYLLYKIYQTINPPDILLPTCSISQSKRFTCILLVTGQHTALISASMVVSRGLRNDGWCCSAREQPGTGVCGRKGRWGKGQHLHPPLGCLSAQLCSCGPHTALQSRRVPTHNSSASVTFQLSLFLLVRWSVLLNTAAPAQTKLVLLECNRTQKAHM